MREIEQRAADAYRSRFGETPEVVASAPGRVNLLGEHTDYNGGFVLPCAIERRVVVALGHGANGLYSVDHDDAQPCAGPRAENWADYPHGVVWALEQTGAHIPAFQAAITGDVPAGAGLSSSAAIEAATALALDTLLGLNIARTDLALLCQRAENEFVKVDSGIMDQYASLLCQQGSALLIDCRSLAVKPVPVPDNAAIMIFNSNVTRGLVDSAYNVRREQCETAARHFGIPALRDLDLATLEARAGELDPVVLRRARHVVTEDDRVLAAADALQAGDLERLGALMAASHASMRDDFEITVPAIDNLVDIVKGVIGTQGGVRMTGGGFGGCVVAVVPHALVDAARAAVEREYRSPDGKPATIYVCKPAAGAGTVKP